MTRPALLSLDDALPQLLAQVHALRATQEISTFDAGAEDVAQQADHRSAPE